MIRRMIMFHRISLCVLLFVVVSCKQSEAVKIGVILPLTGPGAPYGSQVLDGVQLANKIVLRDSQLSDLGIRLIVEDSRTQANAGVAALNKLIFQDRVKVVIGELASSITLACAPIAERNRVILLSPGSSADEITKAGQYIYRIAPTDSYDGKYLATKMRQKFDIRRVSILYLNNDFGIGLKSRFRTVFESLGGAVIHEESAELGSVDFRTQIVKLVADSPDAMLAIASGGENVVFLKQLRQLGADRKSVV